MSQSDNSVFVIYREGGFGFEEVSQALGMKPDSASKGGENGNNAVWKLFASTKESFLEDQVESWVSLLKHKGNELQKLREQGWSIDLDCLIQSDDGAAVVGFEPELLRKLSHLQIRLIIRVWD
jgi:hypothetical protein